MLFVSHPHFFLGVGGAVWIWLVYRHLPFPTGGRRRGWRPVKISSWVKQLFLHGASPVKLLPRGNRWKSLINCGTYYLLRVVWMNKASDRLAALVGFMLRHYRWQEGREKWKGGAEGTNEWSAGFVVMQLLPTRGKKEHLPFGEVRLEELVPTLGNSFLMPSAKRMSGWESDCCSCAFFDSVLNSGAIFRRFSAWWPQLE